MIRNQPVMPQFICSVMIATTLFLGSVSTAKAAITDLHNFKLDSDHVDFGTGTHSFGSPSGNATLTYSETVVNDSFGPHINVTARVQGTMYWDSIDPGCVEVDVSYYGIGTGELGKLIGGAPSHAFCGVGGDPNKTANHITIDETFSAPSLDNVEIILSKKTGGTFFRVTKTNFSDNITPKFFNVNINNGSADFGSGLHAFGGPTGDGQVQILNGIVCKPDGFNCVDDNGTLLQTRTASVNGILYWDNLFSSGCARIQPQWQDASGNALGNTPTRDKCGPGGNANDSDNKRLIDVDTGSISQTFASLFKVQIKTGTVSNGTFSNTVTKTFPLVGAVGIFGLEPRDTVVRAQDRLNYELTWTVPEPLKWRDLKSLQVRIRGNGETLLWLIWDEESNTFAVLNEAAGRFGRPAPVGSPARLETKHATVFLAQSSADPVESPLGSGPTSPNVLLKLALSFKPSAVGGPFQVEVNAADDLGHEDPFAVAGTLTVTARN